MTIRTRTLGWAAAIVLAIALLAYGTWAYAEGRVPFGQSDEWTGVFLTNGQAYFGHFYSAPGDYVILRDVHYVLATQLQPQDPKTPAQTQLTLQRKGSEIYGPQSEMRIAKSQILYLETLRPDSPLVQQIRSQRISPNP